MFDITALIKTAGYVGITAIVFAESGLLIGFFLPGDSLLFTAGFLASQGYLNIVMLLPLLFVAAVAGDSVGYWFGKKIGPKLFIREESLLFRKSHVEKTQKFFELHGKKTIILARFIPVVRTFAPVLAGVGSMEYKTFLTYNVVGGLLWAVGVTLAGFFLGRVIPDVDKYLLPIIVGIVILSVLPVLKHLFSKS